MSLFLSLTGFDIANVHPGESLRSVVGDPIVQFALAKVNRQPEKGWEEEGEEEKEEEEGRKMRRKS